MMLMMLMAHRHKGTVDELSRADVAYDACLTMFGAMDHQQHHTKSISIGWIIFSVLIFEIYFAKLTAILSEPPQIVPTISGIKVRACPRRGVRRLVGAFACAHVRVRVRVRVRAVCADVHGPIAPLSRHTFLHIPSYIPSTF